jgi:hypothetical protein
MELKMSFRVDLRSKEGVKISLMIVRTHIVVIFNPCKINDNKTAYKLIDKLEGLLSSFNLKHYLNMVRGDDSEHIKRHHGYDGEVRFPHLHISYDRDVTLEMLKELLEGVLNAQVLMGRFQLINSMGLEASSNDNSFQFIDLETATDVVQSFAVFYKKFLGSDVQKQFLADRELTKTEKVRLAEHAKREERTLPQSDTEELERYGFSTAQIQPKFTKKRISKFSTFINFFSCASSTEISSDTPAPLKLEGLGGL